MTRKDIIGVWKIFHDETSFDIYGDISLEFKDNGDLIYTAYHENKREIMYLTYEIRNDVLITNQPSFPREEKTKYKMLSSIELELYFEGVKSVYIKVV